MPTGYTCCIAEGISFKDFVLQCARAFGACIMQRDDSLSPQLKMDKPSDYYSTNLELDRKKLAHLYSSDSNDLMIEFASYINSRVKECVDNLEANSLLLTKYQEMLCQVQTWTPPTEDHKGLKDFMIQQIESSIKWDCHTSFYNEEIDRLKSLTFDEWKVKEMEALESNILYCTEKNREEIERCNERNSWKKQLIESLGD